MKFLSTNRVVRFIEARFTPGGELGLHLTAGVLLMVLTTALFGMLAGAVMGQTGIALLDLRVSQWFNAHAAEPLAGAVALFSQMVRTMVKMQSAWHAVWSRESGGSLI